MANNNKKYSISQDCWLDIKKVSELKGITPRAVRMAAQKDKYISKIQDGKTLILLSSLELEVREKYLGNYYKNIAFDEIKENSLIQLNQSQTIPDSVKEIALARMDLLRLWKEYRKAKASKSQANKEFVELYNTGELYPQVFKTLGKTSIGTIYRWKDKLSNTSDWQRLAPKYSYSNEYRTSLTDEEKNIFMKLLLSQNKFNIGKATALTKYILKKRGYQIFPRDITFRRYAEWFKKNNYDKWILSREGQKALRDKVEPFIVRDATLLEVGDVLVADGHRLNFQVINPFTGKPTRATLVGFLDWRSGALVGYEIMLEENTQCIASALRNSILNLGKVPKIVYQDNGKAFKAKFFIGSDFEELGFSGLYGKLGIKPIFAKPYNARAKVIERFFLEFQESFEKLLPSYTGSSIEHKPAYLKRNEKLHKEIHNDYIPTIQEAIRMIECWLVLPPYN